jgi:hypothetical protein
MLMRPGLPTAIGIVAAVGGCLSLFFVYSMVKPTDETAFVLGGLWILMPYLTALIIAGLCRQYRGVLITLLVALALVTFVGVSMYQSSAAPHADARHQPEPAVLPGEDPNSAPAALRKSGVEIMRKVGAEIGAGISNVFSILLAVVLPPVQSVGVAVPTLIAYVVSRKKSKPVDRDAGLRSDNRVDHTTRIPSIVNVPG